MYVQKIITVENKERYLLLDENYEIIQPVKKYLKYLDITRHKFNTIKNYAFHLKLYYEYLYENNLKYVDIESNLKGIEIISEFMAWLTLSQNGKTRSEKTINIIIGTVINFYEYLIRINEIEKVEFFNDYKKNYFKGFLYETTKSKMVRSNIFHLKERNKKIKTITREQYELIFENCESFRNKLIISLMFEAGLRLGETIGLKLKDFDAWDNKVRIVARDNEISGVSVKNNSEGELYIPNYVTKILCQYITSEYKVSKTDYLFVNLNGKNIGMPMKPITVQKFFETIRKSTNIKVTPHVLRHSHATELIEVGNWDPLFVKERLRHKHIQTTISTYVHLSDNYKKEQFKIFQEKVAKSKDEN